MKSSFLARQHSVRSDDPSCLQGILVLSMLTVIFKAILMVTDKSKQAPPTKAPFVFKVAALTAVSLAISRPDQLNDDNFSSLWVLVSMFVLNACETNAAELLQESLLQR